MPSHQRSPPLQVSEAPTCITNSSRQPPHIILVPPPPPWLRERLINAHGVLKYLQDTLITKGHSNSGKDYLLITTWAHPLFHCGNSDSNDDSTHVQRLYGTRAYTLDQVRLLISRPSLQWQKLLQMILVVNANWPPTRPITRVIPHSPKNIRYLCDW